jgi:serine/threonine protein kinase
VLLSGGRYTASIDVWAAGCILAELLQRKPLFMGENYLHQLQLINETLGTPLEEDLEFVRSPPARAFMLQLPLSKGKHLPDLFPQVRGPCLDLLGRMLTFNPDKRISLEDAIAHPFLARVRAARKSLNEDIVPSPRIFRMRVRGGSSELKSMPVDDIKARFYAELCGLAMTPTPTSPPFVFGNSFFSASAALGSLPSAGAALSPPRPAGAPPPDRPFQAASLPAPFRPPSAREGLQNLPAQAGALHKANGKFPSSTMDEEEWEDEEDEMEGMEEEEDEDEEPEPASGHRSHVSSLSRAESAVSAASSAAAPAPAYTRPQLGPAATGYNGIFADSRSGLGVSAPRLRANDFLDRYGSPQLARSMPQTSLAAATAGLKAVTLAPSTTSVGVAALAAVSSLHSSNLVGSKGVIPTAQPLSQRGLARAGSRLAIAGALPK